MIIQCKQCATKFRFNDEHMMGEGVWLRCSRCGHVFFEVNARQDAIPPPAREEGPAAIRDPAVSPVVQDRTVKPEPVVAPVVEEKAVKEEPAAVPAGPPKPKAETGPAIKKEDELEEEEEEEEEEEPPRTGFWTPSRIVAYSLAVLLVIVGVYLWLFPQISRDVLDFVSPGSADRLLGPAPKAAPASTSVGIHFAEVKERFTKSVTAGDILIISGLAVNEYEYPIEKVKLRGKILDPAGKTLGEVESFAGNLLTDDELNRLTDKEILAELQKPEGSDVPNKGIRSRASIPFMIIFMNPPKEVDEFVIELSGVERAAVH